MLENVNYTCLVMKTRRGLRQTKEEEAIIHGKNEDEEVQEIKEEVHFQPIFIEEQVNSLTYENLLDHYWTKAKLPSSLWAVHRETTGKFVAFSHISENTSKVFVSTDKMIMFDGTLEFEVFVRGKKVELTNLAQQNICTLEELDSLLHRLEVLRICKGTGLDNARYSPECLLILDRKYRNSRCSNCATRRTHLKKTEAQRLRRAAARQKDSAKVSVESRRQPKKKDMDDSEDRSATEDYDMHDEQVADDYEHEIQGVEEEYG
ncbi:hypothetical protein C0J52_12060 [Blattella germanica]|nr:hypothetical protein C0J52_12060 [Blattella germanica]